MEVLTMQPLIKQLPCLMDLLSGREVEHKINTYSDIQVAMCDTKKAG
jgi:hypothetical protein